MVILIAFQVSFGNDFVGFYWANYYGEASHRYPSQIWINTQGLVILIAFQASFGNHFMGFECANYYGEASHRYFVNVTAKSHLNDKVSPGYLSPGWHWRRVTPYHDYRWHIITIIAFPQVTLVLGDTLSFCQGGQTSELIGDSPFSLPCVLTWFLVCFSDVFGVELLA